MSAETPVVPESRDLLGAIRDALTVPYPARIADFLKRDALIAARAADVCAIIDALLDSTDPDVGWWAERLRQYTTPAAYPVQAEVTLTAEGASSPSPGGGGRG